MSAKYGGGNYRKADWEYPYPKQPYFTYPAEQIMIDRLGFGAEYPISGDLTTVARRLKGMANCPFFRDEDMQKP